MTTKTKNKLYGIGNALLSELFPDRCAICDKLLDSGKCVCDDCNDSFSRQPRKFYSGKTLCYSVCEYRDVNKKIVLGAKKGRDFYKLSFMATEIYELLKNNGVMDEIEVIVPAPMSLAKRLKKGFNHTEKLTRHISYLSGIDTVKAVKKIRETREQKTLSREERRVGVFTCRKTGHNLLKHLGMNCQNVLDGIKQNLFALYAKEVLLAVELIERNEALVQIYNVGILGGCVGLYLSVRIVRLIWQSRRRYPRSTR